MEPIGVILAALATGAAAGTSEAAADTVREAYAALRSAVRSRFADRPAADYAIEQYTADPDHWKADAEAELRSAGADRDAIILAAARAVLAHTDPAGSAAERFVVDVTGAQGVQIGDGNTQTNHFGPG